MKTRMSLRTWPVVALALAGCGSGRWVDAPKACENGWRPVQLAYENALFDQQFTHKPVQKFSSDDLRQVREQVLAEQRKKGASGQALRRTGDGLERLIAEGGRAVCGNIGMSYTGEWECTAQQQRVKCK